MWTRMLCPSKESRHFARHSSLIRVEMALDRHFFAVTNRDASVPSLTSVGFGIAPENAQSLGRGGDGSGLMTAKGARPEKSLVFSAFVWKNCGTQSARKIRRIGTVRITSGCSLGAFVDFYGNNSPNSE